MDGDRIRVRPLTEADAEAFWDVRLRALREHPEAFGRSFDEERDTPLAEVRRRARADWTLPAGFVLGAFLGDRLVGIVGLRRADLKKERHKATLWGMYVVPEARGRGVGRALLVDAIARAKSLPGLEQVQLSVGSRSDAARALYASLGFEPYGLERRALKLDDAYVDEEHMVLHLAGPPTP